MGMEFGFGLIVAISIISLLLTFLNVLFITVMVKHIVNHYNFYKWVAVFVFVFAAAIGLYIYADAMSALQAAISELQK